MESIKASVALKINWGNFLSNGEISSLQTNFCTELELRSKGMRVLIKLVIRLRSHHAASERGCNQLWLPMLRSLSALRRPVASDSLSGCCTRWEAFPGWVTLFKEPILVWGCTRCKYRSTNCIANTVGNSAAHRVRLSELLPPALERLEQSLPDRMAQLIFVRRYTRYKALAIFSIANTVGAPAADHVGRSLLLAVQASVRVAIE